MKSPERHSKTEKKPKSEEDQKQFEKAIKKFMKKSKHANTHYVGKPPKATRDVVDDSFTYALIVSFKSAKEQEKYQKENYVQLYKRDSRALDAVRKRITRRNFNNALNHDMATGQISFHCIHGGRRFQSLSKGLLPNQR